MCVKLVFCVLVCVQNEELISKGNILILKDATFDTAGTYVCQVTVPEIEGMETIGTLQVKVQGKSNHKIHLLNMALLSGQESIQNY